MLELLLLSFPSAAAPCGSAEGVSVVVDFNELGGGAQQVCIADGGGDKASDLFPAAGYPLTYAQRQPGFVCRVSGVPASDPCVNASPADAFWSLWWSDGESGEWTYSSLGAMSLRIPEGGSVGFAWDQSDGEVRPGAAPATHDEPSPTPTSTPSPTQTPSPTSSPPPNQTGQPTPTSSGTPTPTTTPSTTASPTETPTRTPSESPTGAPSETAMESTTADPTATPTPGPATAPAASDPDDGLPVWVAPLALALLAAAGGAAVVLRRRSAHR